MTNLETLLAPFDLPEGWYQTRLPQVRLFKASEHIGRCPIVYEPGLCIVLQGHKVGHLGERSFQYDADHYLVTSVAVPFECETFATPEQPVLGLYISIDLPLLNELILQLEDEPELRNPSSLPCATGPAVMDEALKDTVRRLLGCLASAAESRVLGPGLLREMLYRALCGCQAGTLYALARKGSQFARVARAIHKIQHDYDSSLDIEQLASHAGMSPSAFHRAFKSVTHDSPLQYLKKIRLNKARDLMLQQGMKAYLAADSVGYESASQFSREFKRYFGRSPAEMAQELRPA